MEILTKTELRVRLDEVIENIREGAIFIYPTDTIYGIGCNALNQKSVQKIREIKQRQNNPFSIWVPSIEWIKNNFIMTAKSKKWLDKLPGPYTLIMQLKESKSLPDNINPTEDDFIGVRLPEHWFSKIVEMLNFPLVTTSVNKTGEPFMTSLEDLDPEIQKKVEFIIYEGDKNGRPSKIVNVEKEDILER